METIIENFLTSMEWMDRAACIGMDPQMFFPPGEVKGAGVYRQARSVCYDCPVINDCLEYALREFPRQDDDHGMWGGTTPRERRRIHRTRRVHPR